MIWLLLCAAIAATALTWYSIIRDARIRYRSTHKENHD